MFSSQKIALCELILEEAQTLGVDCYVVGGVLRDILLEKQALDTDIDLIVIGLSKELGVAIAERLGATIRSFDTFLTTKVEQIPEAFGCSEVDLVSARRESYPTPGALPVVQPGSLAEDLSRRDFTINAMALPLTLFIHYAKNQIDQKEMQSDIVDLYNGMSDLHDKKITVLHQKSFIDDPTRLIRLVRYVCRLQVEVDEETQKLVREARTLKALSTISVERLWSEFRKALAEPSLDLVVEHLWNIDFFTCHPEFSSLFKGLSKERLEVYASGVEEFDLSHREHTLQSILVAQMLLEEQGTLRKIKDREKAILVKVGVGKRRIRMVERLMTELKAGTMNVSDSYSMEAIQVISKVVMNKEIS